MINNFIKYAFIVMLSTITIFSCTKEIDFNQINDVSLKPVVALNLIFFNALASDFFIDRIEQSTIKDTVVIDLFNRGFIIDNLVKAELVFETTNSIDKSFNIKVDFLDTSNRLKHTFTLTAPASPLNTDIITSHIEVFENTSLDALKVSNKIELTLQALSGGMPLNNDTPGVITLKSKGVFFLNIERDTK